MGYSYIVCGVVNIYSIVV